MMNLRSQSVGAERTLAEPSYSRAILALSGLKPHSVDYFAILHLTSSADFG
jgi:hypothetical protein